MTEQTEQKQTYKKGYGLKTETLEQETNKIDVEELRRLCLKFHENMETLYHMLLLPYVLCTDEFLAHNELLLTLEARLASKTTNKWGEEMSGEDRNRYLAEEKRIWETKYKPKKEQLFEEAFRKGEEKFGFMLKNPYIYNSYRSLLYSGIVFIWCSFEVFMKDLWEIALNMAGKRVKKIALVNIGKSEDANNYSGIKGKYISLDYLGQYNYNITNKLGSILVNKFDFTSPYGMKDAYLCAFPRSTTIREAVENEGLIQLEARRNVIVHRAGILDAAFCKKTGINQKEIGTNLQLSEEEVLGYGNVTIDVALKMIKAVSSILSSSKKKATL